MDVRQSTRLTLSGRCANGCDSHRWGGDRKNESKYVKEVENRCDCERLLRGDVPLRKMLRSKEEGCMNVGLNVNLASVNESVSVRPNVSESGGLELGNESVTD